MKQNPIIAFEKHRVGLIHLNRPENHNCLSADMLEMLGATVEEFSSNPAVKVILITAEGKNFSTGADISELRKAQTDSDQLKKFLERGHRVFNQLESYPYPVVAAVQGLCLAGGMELTLACDIVFASKSAMFGDQHAKYGFVPGWGASQRLQRIIGLRKTKDLMFSGRWISSEEALDLGLVNGVNPTDTLHIDSLKYCKDLIKLSKKGLSATKQMLNQGSSMSLREGLEFELGLSHKHLMSDDVEEGLAAFDQDRDPVFD